METQSKSMSIALMMPHSRSDVYNDEEKASVIDIGYRGVRPRLVYGVRERKEKIRTSPIISGKLKVGFLLIRLGVRRISPSQKWSPDLAFDLEVEELAPMRDVMSVYLDSYVFLHHEAQKYANVSWKDSASRRTMRCKSFENSQYLGSPLYSKSIVTLTTPRSGAGRRSSTGCLRGRSQHRLLFLSPPFLPF